MTTITNNKNTQSPIGSEEDYLCPACGKPYTTHTAKESEECANNQ